METKRWKFCPECGGKLEDAWKHCAGCGLEVGAVVVIVANPQPQPFVYPIYPQPYQPCFPPQTVPQWPGYPWPNGITTTTGPLPNVCGTLVM